MNVPPGNPILLVEDNDDDVFAIQRALKVAQISNPLQVVTDGQQALDYLRASGKYSERDKFPLPSVMFLDLKLPYVHGFEVLSAMRQHGFLNSIPVVVLTSSAEDRDHEKASALGARSYLVKPPTGAMLKEVFNSLQGFCLLKSTSSPVTENPPLPAP